MKNSIDRQIENVLKKEKQAFPLPSPTLKQRLYASAPSRTKRIAWKTMLGFVSAIIILLSICLEHPSRPIIVNNYFEPTKVVDLNDLDFKPTKVVQLTE